MFNKKEKPNLIRDGLPDSQKIGFLILNIFIFGIFVGLIIADIEFLEANLFSIIGFILFITLILTVYIFATKLNDAYVKMTFMSITDELTQLVNRKHFDYLFEIELARAKRYEKNLSLAIIEIDYYEEIKINHGHQVRNEVLQETAEILKDEIRINDILAREDDRFICLLPETNLESAKYVFNRLRAIVEWETIRTGNSEKKMRVTISTGFAFCNPCFDKNIDVNKILNVAHEALNIAKNNGRNRVEFLYTK